MSNIKLDESIFSMRRLLMSVLWPSFIMACVSSLVFYTLANTEALSFQAISLEISMGYLYSIAFFIFWLLGAMTSALTALLMCQSR